MRTLITCTIFLTAAQCLVARAASAEDIVIPESWEGVWETTTTERDCDTLEFIRETTTPDTLCAGDTMNPEDPDGEFPTFDCNGTVTDEAIHMECSGTMEVFPGCDFTMSIVTDGTLNGDTSSGVTIVTTTFTGPACGPVEDTCTRYETTSVRTGEDPGCGISPVDSPSWGTLKSTFR